MSARRARGPARPGLGALAALLIALSPVSWALADTSLAQLIVIDPVVPPAADPADGGGPPMSAAPDPGAAAAGDDALPRGDDPDAAPAAGPVVPRQPQRADPAAAPAPQARPAATVSGLVPLDPDAPPAGAPLRLTGERDQAAFLMLAAAVPPDGLRLRLVHRSGIDLLPELSALSVRVNGAEVTQIEPDGFAGFVAAEIDLPADLLQPGANLLEVTARQHHRIFCGPEASFALWTDIDTRDSGLLDPAVDAGSPPAAADGAAAFLAAVARQNVSGEALALRAPPAMWEDLVGPLTPLVADLAVRLGGEPPALQFEPPIGVAAIRPPEARITVLPPEAGAPAPALRRGGDGALVLVLNATARADGLFRDLPAPDLWLPVRSAPPALVPGAAVTLAALGQDTLAGTERYFLREVAFRLPEDWLLLASQKATLDLRYGFAPGLPSGAQLMVKINDTTVQLLPLDRGDGRALPPLEVRFAASLLRPGPNRLAFEAFIPGDPPDLPCPPAEGPLLQIRADTALSVPPAPRMRQPDIAATLRMVVQSGAQLAVTADARRLIAPEARLRLAAVLAPLPEWQAAAPTPAPIPAPVFAAAPATDGALPPADEAAPTPGRPKITLATMADFGGLQVRALPLDRAMVETVLLPMAPAGAAASGGAADGAGGQPGDMPGQPSPGALSLWQVLGIDGLGPRLRDRVRPLVQRLSGHAGALEPWIEGRSAVAMIVQPDMAVPDDLWLVLGPGLRPPDTEALLTALKDPRPGKAADSPQGQLALLADDGRWQSWTAPDRPLLLLEPLDRRNLRAVLGNYASWWPGAFVAAVLGLTALSALLAILVVILSRRRP